MISPSRDYRGSLVGGRTVIDLIHGQTGASGSGILCRVIQPDRPGSPITCCAFDWLRRGCLWWWCAGWGTEAGYLSFFLLSRTLISACSSSDRLPASPDIKGLVGVPSGVHGPPRPTRPSSVSVGCDSTRLRTVTLLIFVLRFSLVAPHSALLCLRVSYHPRGSRTGNKQLRELARPSEAGISS